MTDTNANPAVTTTPAAPTPDIEDVVGQAAAAADAPPAAPDAASYEDKSTDDLSKMSETELDALLAAGTTTVAPVPTETAPAPSGDSPAAPVAEEEEGDPNEMVPRARLNQEIKKRKEAETTASKALEDRAFAAGKAEGVIAASAARPGQAIEQADPVKVITANLNQLKQNFDEAQDTLASRFDNAELTATEWRKEERKLIAAHDRLRRGFETQLNDAREQASQPDPDTFDRTVNQSPALKTFTDNLMTENPWFNKLPASMEKPLRTAAEDALTAQGIVLGPKATTQDVIQYTAELRMALVDIARQWGMDKTLGGQAAPAAPAAPTTPPKPTQDQIKTKLTLATQQPPSPNQAGTNLPTNALDTLPTETMTVDDLMKLSPEQLNALEERERQRGQAA